MRNYFQSKPKKKRENTQFPSTRRMRKGSSSFSRMFELATFLVTTSRKASNLMRLTIERKRVVSVVIVGVRYLSVVTYTPRVYIVLRVYTGPSGVAYPRSNANIARHGIISLFLQFQRCACLFSNKEIN